ncbi:MAG: outer membrane beta-barrel protein [Methylococcales bacterium]
MKKIIIKGLVISCLILPYISPVLADDISEIKIELAKMRSDYEQRIQQLEKRLTAAEAANKQVANEVAVVKATPFPKTHSINDFNPAISLVLNGQYGHNTESPGNYLLSGYSLQNEAGLAPEGFSLGESEITLSANVDQLFAGQATFALADNAGNVSIGIEEAYIETLGLGYGLTVRAGRFFSPIGYLNERHTHAWNFSDAPLIYRGLFGDQLTTDGLKLSYILPTDQLVELGATIGSGGHYPGNGNHRAVGDWLVFAKTGGDIGISHSWQAGVAHWESSPKDRSFGNGTNPVLFNGNTNISNLSLIYKWAPNGNPTQQNFILQSEFFYQHEDGMLSNSNTLAISNYNAKHYGGYLEGIYQFAPRWRAGLRYDRLGSSFSGSNISLFNTANFDLTGSNPQRYSFMLEWLPSEFSRIRAQLNYDQSSLIDDTQLFLQYTVNLGTHGAHSY